MTEQPTFVVPSSEADRKKLKDCVEEIANSLTRIKSEQEFIKEAAKEIGEALDIPSGVIKQMARQYNDDTFDKKQAANEAFSDLYEITMYE